jgi:hypothetical protein
MDHGLFSQASAFAQPTFFSVLLINEHPSIEASTAGVTPLFDLGTQFINLSSSHFLLCVG